MTPIRFAEFQREFFRHCEGTANRKALEYAGQGTNRFHNFAKAAALSGCTLESALWGMMVKHLVSLSDMVEAVERGIDAAEYLTWEEKITDAVVYLSLLLGMRRAADDSAGH